MDVGVREVGVAAFQEIWNRVALQSLRLAGETRDVVFEQDSFREFSRSISALSLLLQALNGRKLEAALGSEVLVAALDKLDSQLKEGHKIIQDYKSGSRLSLLFRSRSVLSRMEDLAKGIAATVSLFQLTNLDMGFQVKSMTEQIINELNTMEFKRAASMESFASEMENSLSVNSRNRDNAMRLLKKIADAVGANANASMLTSELELLKQEKEEMEAEKKQAEALQLSQLIQLLYNTEIVTMPQNEDVSSYRQQYPVGSITCPLSNEVMADPVAILCGHSFERKAIEQYFRRGETKCPSCGEELPSLDLTPNVNLRRSIEEWRKRDMDLRFQVAVSGMKTDDASSKNKALEDLQVLMEMPQYATKAVEEGLVVKFLESLKKSQQNVAGAIKCLHCVAKYCEDQKQVIVEARAVRWIVKHIGQGETEPDEIELLFELSKREDLVDKIGQTRDCIPMVVSLLYNDNADISERAKNILQNLSSNTHFVVKMAESGYFEPFVQRFNEGPQEARALMVSALVEMQPKENNIRDLEDMQFIHNLIQMLSSNSPAYKLACIKGIKKLITYPKMVEQLLLDPATIPLLLGLISLVRSDPHLKLEAAEILALLIGGCRHAQLQTCQGLHELQSQHNVNLFLEFVASSDPQTKIHFLHLLVELCQKSEKARSLIIADMDAVNLLFSSLNADQAAIRRLVMRLIICISEDCPVGIPLPPSPAKEAAINTLAAILTSSVDVEEQSIAANIISRLPKDDVIIDQILSKSQTLKVIHEVICNSDDGYCGSKPGSQGKYLLENVLAALLRFTEPAKPDLQRQVGNFELYPSLVRVLSTGSPLAKQRTAIAIAQLSRSTSLTLSSSNGSTMAKETKASSPLLQVMKLFPFMSWCSSASPDSESLCSIHGAACSQRHMFCLLKADAVKPLLQSLSETDSGVAEAALMALETLLIDHNTLPHATATIVDNQGILAILHVLEKGSLSAKIKALDLFQKILNHTQMSEQLYQRSEGILIQLLHVDDLKKKAALVLKQMGVIPEQSSYF